MSGKRSSTYHSHQDAPIFDSWSVSFHDRDTQGMKWCGRKKRRAVAVVLRVWQTIVDAERNYRRQTWRIGLEVSRKKDRGHGTLKNILCPLFPSIPKQVHAYNVATCTQYFLLKICEIAIHCWNFYLLSYLFWHFKFPSQQWQFFISLSISKQKKNKKKKNQPKKRH